MDHKPLVTICAAPPWLQLVLLEIQDSNCVVIFRPRDGPSSNIQLVKCADGETEDPERDNITVINSSSERNYPPRMARKHKWPAEMNMLWYQASYSRADMCNNILTQLHMVGRFHDCSSGWETCLTWRGTQQLSCKSVASQRPKFQTQSVNKMRHKRSRLQRPGETETTKRIYLYQACNPGKVHRRHKPVQIDTMCGVFKHDFKNSIRIINSSYCYYCSVNSYMNINI